MRSKVCECQRFGGKVCETSISTQRESSGDSKRARHRYSTDEQGKKVSIDHTLLQLFSMPECCQSTALGLYRSYA